MINSKFNPKTLTLLSANAVRKNKLNERITHKGTVSLVNNILKNNEGGLYHVNSYNEGQKDRIHLMMYGNESCEFDMSSNQYSVFYFVDKNALSEKQINEIRQEFQISNDNYGIKRDCDNDTKYQEQFEEKIKELGVDLYVFDYRLVRNDFEYLGNGFGVNNQI